MPGTFPSVHSASTWVSASTADVSSFFWLSRYCIFFLLTWLLYSAVLLSILSEVCYLNFLRLRQYYNLLPSTTPVLLQYYSVLQSTTPVLQRTTPVLCTTKYYKVPTQYYNVLVCTTRQYYKVLLQYYSVLQSTTPVLLCTTTYYSSTTLYYKVLLCTTKFYSGTTLLQSTTPVLLCTTKYYSFQQKLPEVQQKDETKIIRP